MKFWIVKRPKNNNVIVTVARNKCDGTYSFVNLTKMHICPCKFESIEAAIADMDRKMEKGEINRYEEIKYPIVENGL